jgi:hypothetical protein
MNFRNEVFNIIPSSSMRHDFSLSKTFNCSKMLVLNARFSAMLSSSISRHDLLFPKNTSAEFHE